MVPIHTLTLLFAATLLTSNVQAESLLNAPFMPRDNNNGVVPLDKNNMVRGVPADPQTYVAVNRTNGNAMMMRNGEVVGEADMLNSAMDDRENSEISYLETQFNVNFVKNADEIMQKWPRGQPSKIPWPGSYWPTFQDSINVRWNGGPSATEKYARSYGLDVQDFMTKVSLDTGIESRSRWQNPPPRCRGDNECSSGGGQEEVCAKREGSDTGFCIPTWEGICHAWTPAAILEDEPKCPVTIGDVTYQPNDLKALISEIYDSAGTGTLYAGLRFYGGDDDAMDEYGRFVNYPHRDMSPAALHLVCANLMGRSNVGFILDADAGAQVWNQPVRSYEFADVQTMDPSEAAQRFFNRATYPFNNDAKKIQYVKNTFSYIVEPRSYDEDGELAAPGLVDRYTTTKQYEYLLELDDNNNIVGGEWVGDTRYNDHPDFIWFAFETPKDDYMTSTGISYDFVRMLTYLSRSIDC